MIYIHYINQKFSDESKHQNSKSRKIISFIFVSNSRMIVLYFLHVKSNYKLIRKDKDVSCSTCQPIRYIFSDVLMDEQNRAN